MSSEQIHFQNQTFDVIGLIRKGHYKKSYHVRDQQDKSYTLCKMKCMNSTLYEHQRPYLEKLVKLKHHNIARFYAFEMKEGKKLFLYATEYLHDSICLNDRLDQREPIEPGTKYLWMLQLTEGLFYLESHKILHEDLNPSTVFIIRNNDNVECVKITECGTTQCLLALYHGEHNFIDDKTAYLSPYINNCMNHDPASEYWWPPEIFDTRYSQESDVFSLGLLFYTIHTQEFIVFEGKHCYGCFLRWREQDRGLGFVMSEQSGAKEFRGMDFDRFFIDKHAKELKALLNRVLLYNMKNRLPLSDMRNTITEICFNSLTGGSGNDGDNNDGDNNDGNNNDGDNNDGNNNDGNNNDGDNNDGNNNDANWRRNERLLALAGILVFFGYALQKLSG